MFSEIRAHHWRKLWHDLLETGIQEKGIILTHVLARNQIGQGMASPSVSSGRAKLLPSHRTAFGGSYDKRPRGPCTLHVMLIKPELVHEELPRLACEFQANMLHILSMVMWMWTVAGCYGGVDPFS